MKVYHTQENRRKLLEFSIPCIRDDAWLGEAHYFWKDVQDAYDWGNNAKSKSGKFEIYECDIKSENYLDTVFNEEHYDFWLKELEKIAKNIIKKTGEKPTIKELNDFIRDKHVWDEVDYIQFQDLPINQEKSLTKPIEFIKNGRKHIRTIAFRKRIQIAVYNSEIISNFALSETVNAF